MLVILPAIVAPTNSVSAKTSSLAGSEGSTAQAGLESPTSFASALIVAQRSPETVQSAGSQAIVSSPLSDASDTLTRVFSDEGSQLVAQAESLPFHDPGAKSASRKGINLRSATLNTTGAGRRGSTQKKTGKEPSSMSTVLIPAFWTFPNTFAPQGTTTLQVSHSNSFAESARSTDSRAMTLPVSRFLNSASPQGVDENSQAPGGESPQENGQSTYLSFMVNLAEKFGEDGRSSQTIPTAESVEPIPSEPTGSSSNGVEDTASVGTAPSASPEALPSFDELVGNRSLRSKSTSLPLMPAVNLTRSTHRQDAEPSLSHTAISQSDADGALGESSTSSDAQTLTRGRAMPSKHISSADSSPSHTGKAEMNDNSDSQMDLPGTTADLVTASVGRLSDPTITNSLGDRESSGQDREELPTSTLPTPSVPRSLQPGSTSQIAIRLDSGNNVGQIELRIRERAGEVQIAVRSSDPGVAGSLRQDLGDLVKRLDPHSGTPEAALTHTASNFEETGRPGSRHALFGDSSNGYSVPDGQQQRQRQQQQNQPNQRQSPPPLSSNTSDFEELEDLPAIINQLRNGVSSS